MPTKTRVATVPIYYYSISQTYLPSINWYGYSEILERDMRWFDCMDEYPIYQVNFSFYKKTLEIE